MAKINSKYIYGGAAVLLLAGLYFWSTRKKGDVLQAKKPDGSKADVKISDVDAQLKKAINRFADASPVGMAGKAPSQAQLDKGYAYLLKTLTERQKLMFIDYSNSFMGGIEQYATSQDSIKAAQTGDISGIFKVLSDTQDMLEKKYGKQDTTEFMKFMNSFDVKKLA